MMRKSKIKKLTKKYKKQVLRDIFILSQKDIDDITRNVIPPKKGISYLWSQINQAIHGLCCLPRITISILNKDMQVQ